MSRSTPRKSRHRHHPSVHAFPASDYESDAAYYLEAHDLTPPVAITPRTNTDLNLSVLRRYHPSIRSIISIAANAVVYDFAAATQSWIKSEVEGTMFVCEQDQDEAETGAPRACVFVLNRHGLDNLIIDLAKASACEYANDLIMLNVESIVGAAQPEVASEDDEEDGAIISGGSLNVIGIWIHADEDDTREVNAAIVQDTWRQVRVATQTMPQPPETLGTMAEGGLPAHAQEEPSSSRRLSITDLFGRRRNRS